MNSSARISWKCGLTLLLLGLPLLAAAEPVVTLNEADFRDRVFACWLGKNIGGTLGMPFEGNKASRELTFYANLKDGEPAANDDLDLQLLWLKAMEERDGRVDARVLGEYWLRFVPVDWNEYGVGKRNMKAGLLPPLSGEYDNAQWKHSNGAWIRSEIWACLAPGCPALAARMAREDACVDHGAAEGTLAEIFTASLESAAFIEHDRDKLIEIGLSMIPAESNLAQSIRAAVNAKKAGKTWMQAREDVIATSEPTGWFQAPRNVAYTMLGWLYGNDDFGKSLCIAVGCGDDTDCTGATLGSLWGILHGTKGIPENWSKPIGLTIKTVAISGFRPPADINELTSRTVAMAKRTLAAHNAPVAIADAPASLARAGELKLSDPEAVRALWALSPYVIEWNEPGLKVTLDYSGSPEIEARKPRTVKVTLASRQELARPLAVEVLNAPQEWRLESTPGKTVTRDGETRSAMNLTFTPPAPKNVEPKNYPMILHVTAGGEVVNLPLTLIGKDIVGADDLALASKGATARADSEYASESGGAAKVIDGVFARPEDFTNRWHSSISTPHPHWIEVKLPQPERIGRVVVRFADPAGYPVKFAGFVKAEGKEDLTQVFEVKKNKESRVYRTKIDPVKTDIFRLVIEKSANPQFPNAAQVSEIELYPAEK